MSEISRPFPERTPPRAVSEVKNSISILKRELDKHYQYSDALWQIYGAQERGEPLPEWITFKIDNTSYAVSFRPKEREGFVADDSLSIQSNGNSLFLQISHLASDPSIQLSEARVMIGGRKPAARNSSIRKIHEGFPQIYPPRPKPKLRKVA